MPDRFTDGLDLTSSLTKETEAPFQTSRDLYGELCKVENLEVVYTQLKEDLRNSDIETLALKAVQERGFGNFLHQLSSDVKAQIYQPGSYSHPLPAQSMVTRSELTAVRDQVVRVLLKGLLASIFQPDLPCEPEPEKAIKWITGVVEGGLTRIYAVNLEECFDARRQERLMDAVDERIGDPEVVDLLRKVLAAPGQDYFRRSLLTSVACEGIDRMLQQAKAIGREGAVSHVKCARFANELIILLDNDAHFDWLLPAVYSRLSEELIKLKSDMGAAEVQSVNLAGQQKLQFLGFELQSTTDRNGRLRVRYKRLGAGTPNEAEMLLPRLKLPDKRAETKEKPAEEIDNSVAIRPSRFGWLRRIRIPGLSLLLNGCRRLHAFKLGRRHLPNVAPIVLCLFMAIIFGWLAPITLICAALIPIGNWRSVLGVGKFARRRPLDATAAAFGIAAVVCLFVVGKNIYSHEPKEVAVAQMPKGFYLGEYRGTYWDEVEPIAYVLYVPPKFENEKGPFPLIVYLHGFGDDTKEKRFQKGLPGGIKKSLRREHDPGFDFVAFCPIDPTGQWAAGSAEIEDALKPLGYIIRHYNIDPKRVYLTGVSNGANGVWRLAEAYPDKWAAVAPISSFINPNIEKVRHIPTYISHGGKDKDSPVARERTFVKEFQKAGADVKYREFPNKGHDIWMDVYASNNLYDWFKLKRKD